jgi:hypothetical protein
MITLMKLFAPICIVLIIATIASLFLRPNAAPTLMWITILSGIAVSVILAVDRQYKRYLKEHHSRAKLVRNAGVDILGILLTIGVAIWLAGFVAALIFPAAASAGESVSPGMGNVIGILSGLVSAMAVGLGVGFLFHWIMGKLLVRLY